MQDSSERRVVGEDCRIALSDEDIRDARVRGEGDARLVHGKHVMVGCEN
jgi:hypothetical protein